MANLTLFRSRPGALPPATDSRNDAGGAAYELPARAALARLAATGCFTPTFYASAETQLERVLEAAASVDSDFLARAALYSRRRGFMKDMPALLCAVLAGRDLERLAEIFPQVIDTGRMLRSFVQILRSGATGRKSLGTAPKRLVREWLERADERRLLEAAVGKAPSLADVVRMVHPRPADAEREAFYAWLLGKDCDAASLPPLTRAFEAWKRERRGAVPAVPFQMLTGLELGRGEWSAIAKSAGWQATRMNLNTFARQGVFDAKGMVAMVAARLADAEAIRRARVFPYQLLAAYLNAGSGVPEEIREALQTAMEIATANVPALPGKVVVCPDVSGSMGQPVTGYRRGASSQVRCIDVAALVTAAFLRRNRSARVLPFETGVVRLRLNPRDSVMTNATRLAGIGGGGTNCSAPLGQLNAEKEAPDLVVFVSDNESWADPRVGRGTAVMAEWERLRARNPRVRLVCIDLVPNTTTQAPEREDILNIGGFSDAVFDLVAAFAGGASGDGHWIREIERQPLRERTPMN